MPHDARGNELKVGDKVAFEGEVTAIYPGADMCNVTLRSKHVRKDGQHDGMTTTAELLEKIEPAPKA